MTTSFMGRSIGIFILVAISAVAASANTNISTCTSITSAGNYDLTGNLPANDTADCLTITGVHSGTVNIYCHDFTISNATTGTPAKKLVNLADNSGATLVLLDHCHFNIPNGDPNQLLVSSAVTNIAIADSGVIGGLLILDCGVGASVNAYRNTFVNAALWLLTCDGATIRDSTFGSYTSASTIGYAISVYGSISTTITGNVITGRSSSAGLDDGIILQGGPNDITTDSTVPSDTTIRTGDNIRNNVISYVYDSCIEFTGRWAYSTVANNDCQHSGLTGISAYWNTSFDHMAFTGNSYSNSGNTGPFKIEIDNPNPPSGSFFTNNTISGNTFPGSSSSFTGGFFGSPFAAHQFSTYAGNRATSNNFGNSVTFQSSGVIDGGLNACLPGDAVPSGAVQCYPFPFSIPGGSLP